MCCQTASQQQPVMNLARWLEVHLVVAVAVAPLRVNWAILAFRFCSAYSRPFGFDGHIGHFDCSA